MILLQLFGVSLLKKAIFEEASSSLNVQDYDERRLMKITKAVKFQHMFIDYTSIVPQFFLISKDQYIYSSFLIPVEYSK